MTDAEAPSAATTDVEMRFGFGENWRNFIEAQCSGERVEMSRRHLPRFLKLRDLSGKTFLDIGCGSGPHSLAA